MRFSKASALLALSTGVLAQRPTDTSICDYYTTALLKNNTAANQYTVLTLVVNTVVIGNYTQPNVGIAVPGILAKGTYNGTAVNLLPYFDGSLASSNRGGNAGVAVNFLDDGGAVPLMANMPANGTASNQYALLTHLYQFFGALLGCSTYGKDGFPAYSGFPSMAAVHRFMKLDENELGYFITQVGLAAASFGVATEDVQAVGMALSKAFGMRCAPEITIIPAQGAQLQAICQADTCPLAANATCSAYPTAGTPLAATATASGASATATGGSNTTASAASTTKSGASATSSSAQFTGAASVAQLGWSLMVGGGAAAMAALL